MGAATAVHLLLCVVVLMQSLVVVPGGAQFAPSLPKEFKKPAQLPAFQGTNLCPYLKLAGTRMLAGCWTCGLKQTLPDGAGEYVFDCCPGYERTDIESAGGGCAYVEPTWTNILKHLERSNHGRTSTAIGLHTSSSDLSSDDSTGTYTALVPLKDDDINMGEINYENGDEKDAIDMHIALGRWYSRDFRNKMTIPNQKGVDLKITTYSNGLVFVECRLLQSPDHEATNGLIHFIDGTMPATHMYPTIIDRLKSISEASEFLDDLPSKLRDRLSNTDPDGPWYTVLVPTNKAWLSAKQGLDKDAINNLVEHHVLGKMLCSGAITHRANSVGPSEAGEYLGVTRLHDGRKAVIDACGQEMPIAMPDMMAGNGAVHVISGAMVPLGSMDIKSAVRCLGTNPGTKVSKAAKEIDDCKLSTPSDKPSIFLLPQDEAYNWLSSSSQYQKEAGSMKGSGKCRVFSHHLLTASGRPSDPVVVGQQEAYRTAASTGSKPAFVTSAFVRERDGTQLFFNHAKAQSLKPIKFKNGVIFVVDKFNFPPENDVMKVVAGLPDMEKTSTKMRDVSYTSVISGIAPKLVFLASIDLGWSTRELENKFSSTQTKNLLMLHTLAVNLFGGDDGFLWRETVQKVDTLLTDRSGKRVQVTIKRLLDGNTLIGHDDLPEDEWSLVMKTNKVATDGVVWVIDWPMKCPPNAC